MSSKLNDKNYYPDTELQVIEKKDLSDITDQMTEMITQLYHEKFP